MSVGEMQSFSVAQIIVFEYIVLIFMSDGVADHVTAIYCSVKCVMFHLWDILQFIDQHIQYPISARCNCSSGYMNLVKMSGSLQLCCLDELVTLNGLDLPDY